MSRDYQGPDYSLDDLRSVIDAMCKSIESSGLIDEHEHPSAYSALLDTSKWMAELDRYGNAKLVDGQHSGRAGADKAMYLIKALHLDDGQRYAVARVELSEPKPSGEGVNNEAIKTLNDARREAQP